MNEEVLHVGETEESALLPKESQCANPRYMYMLYVVIHVYVICSAESHLDGGCALPNTTPWECFSTSPSTRTLH